MKYCPICDERYDEEIIKFCTRDGTPLVEEGEPSFTALPSENLEDSVDDFGEETIIRRKPVPQGGSLDPSERIVIPTSPQSEQQVRPRTSAVYYPPPPQPNTGKIVALTIAGTLVVLGFGAVLFWFLQKETPTNVNTNFNAFLANQNTNLNTNSTFDSNFNFNSTANFNTNLNVNTNLNANLKTPSPTPKLSPSPSPSPSPTGTATPTASASPTPRANANTRPPASPTPRIGPRPPSPTNTRPPGNGN